MANKKATIYDVAKLASVSLATASRVMNGVDKVAADTKERVLNAIKELNYRPSTVAIELASRKNTNVAIIVPEINYTYISHVVAGMMDSATDYGYDCLIFTTKDTKKDINKTIEKVLSIRPNGIIIFNDSLSNEELSELMNFDIPVVSLGMDLKNISSVSWHYKAQIIDLVSDALKRQKEIYFLHVEGSGRIESRVLDGIKQGYLKHNKTFNNIIDVADSYKDTYRVVKELLKTLPPCFIMATRDSIALAALNAALDLDLKVPEDYEFMAMIGTKYSELSRPQLSSFNIDMRGLGKTGMKALAEIIENKDEIINKKLLFKYVKRGSTL
ncbi:MAG: LacI family transcriptional regulator [Erysipelotrichaceae bacterium]|nr:LacI family transcriptional regulator [Erysipelotrichaceae bacterium]